MNRSHQKGVALVITLIMLSVVTFMAITFLALSRRERGAVAVTTSQNTATLMADTALARVQEEIASRLMAQAPPTISNKIAYVNPVASYLSTELMVSTNYISPLGFVANLSVNGDIDLTNVSYNYFSGGLLSPQDRIQNIGRLRFSPRAPVVVRVPFTIGNQTFETNDFRFYLDFNRNGRFDTNGWQRVRDELGNFVRDARGNIVSNYMVGDPEWIGVLDKPWLRHSANNRFIGRYAYLVLPSGKSLDLNFMHNHAKVNLGTNMLGYGRNQGVGTWEMNLAAFLREFNTNQWGPGFSLNETAYTFNPVAGQSSAGWTFIDARSLLFHRYYGDYRNLMTFPQNYNLNTLAGAVPVNNVLSFDRIDEFGAGRMTNILLMTTDPDANKVNSPGWPGSDNPNVYYDVQELFDTNKSSIGFVNRLLSKYNPKTTNSTYDQYAFYRLLGQLGVDSESGLAGKMSLNYSNNVGSKLAETNFIPWTPLGFFTNAARLLLENQPELALGATNFGLNHIPIYPVNYYSPAVHRLMQLAANIHDATIASRQDVSIRTYPYIPSAFRPLFQKINNTVSIAGFIEVTNTLFLNETCYDLNETNNVPDGVEAFLKSFPDSALYPRLVYGIPVTVAARKGWPNFNEFSMQNAIQVSRKLEVRKTSPSSPPTQTNQLYVVGVSNAFGIEAWNSYSQTNQRQLRLMVRGAASLELTNGGVGAPLWKSTVSFGQPLNATAWYVTNIPAGQWLGKQFLIPRFTNFVFLTNMAYFTIPPRLVSFSTNYLFETTRNWPVPEWIMRINARLQYVLIDAANNRIVDYVSLNNLISEIDLTKETMGNQTFGAGAPVYSSEGVFWQTNRANLGDMPPGVRAQIMTSIGQANNTESIWRNFSADQTSGRTREKSIEMFRTFLNLTPLDPYRYPRSEMQQELGNSIARQAPFSPVRKIYQNISWQANDPLVHYMVEDLTDLYRTNNIQFASPPDAVPTNSNLGQLNTRYSPWGGSGKKDVANDKLARNMSVKDPMVVSSDDWMFPTNKFPNIGWLGRVHRGTPWQTVYLKSSLVSTQDWALYSGHARSLSYLFSHPTNDWRFLDLFTTAPNENASRGRLSVNQTNVAAWSAVLSGVSAITNSARGRTVTSTNFTDLAIEPVTPQLRAIVESINQTRLTRAGGMYHTLGEVLAAPKLTVESPYLSQTGNPNFSDEVVERIPQQILSLLKSDEPRITVYTFGQSLAPAPNSLVLSGQYRGLCTNYQIMGEVVTKHVLRLEGTANRPTVVRERFQYLPND